MALQPTYANMDDIPWGQHHYTEVQTILSYNKPTIRFVGTNENVRFNEILSVFHVQFTTFYVTFHKEEASGNAPIPFQKGQFMFPSIV